MLCTTLSILSFDVHLEISLKNTCMMYHDYHMHKITITVRTNAHVQVSCTHIEHYPCTKYQHRSKYIITCIKFISYTLLNLLCLSFTRTSRLVAVPTWPENQGETVWHYALSYGEYNSCETSPRNHFDIIHPTKPAVFEQNSHIGMGVCSRRGRITKVGLYGHMHLVTANIILLKLPLEIYLNKNSL